jgi:methionine-rich copper-binding protein CopC
MQLSGRGARLIVAVAVGGAAVAVLAAVAGPRSDATVLAGATPASGARVDTAPHAVSLSFTTDVVTAHVAVSGARTDAAPRIDGATVSQPVTDTAEGRHEVSYHVQAADGAETSGTLWFTVGDAGAEVAPSTGAHDHTRVDPLTAAVLLANVVAMVVLGALFLRGGRVPR